MLFILFALVSYNSIESSSFVEFADLNSSQPEIPTPSLRETKIIPTISPSQSQTPTNEPVIPTQSPTSIPTPEQTKTEEVGTPTPVPARVFELYIYITISVVAFVVLAIVISYYCVIKKRRERRLASNTAFSDYIMQPSDQFFD